MVKSDSIRRMGYERSFSESSDDIVIRPLELDDLKRRLPIEEDEDCGIPLDQNPNLFFSVAMGKKRTRHVSAPQQDRSSMIRMMWKNAMKKALAMEDPWKKFHLAEYKTEKAKRHRYNPLRQRWVEDIVPIKMEDKPFNHGAMRECFRMKKLSNFSKVNDWKKAHNYVAKRYMSSEIDRETYFHDVKLQMDAKLWGEEYNRHNPPKKVDIFQMAILEMIERDGNPLYHVEHYIEGKYVKYNSNSGFVMAEALRMTPQAFSHFTFERSGHELIVVDIQGVGDLYTDPQIHTAVGHDYGDGNLGTRGMALFFHSHICNSICKSLNLTEFDLFKSEIKECKAISRAQKNAMTVVRGTEECVRLPSESERENIQQYIRIRSMSSGYLSTEERERVDSLGSLGSEESVDEIAVGSYDTDDSGSVRCDSACGFRTPRIHYDSITEMDESPSARASDLKEFKDMVKRKARPSNILSQAEHSKLLECLSENEQLTENGAEEVANQEYSILGAVHLDLAKYHELNRFVEENQDYDRDAALFHLSCSAKCGNLDAQIAMSQIHFGLVHDILPELELDEDIRDRVLGFKYMLAAAEAGDRASMIAVAKAYDKGIDLPDVYSTNWETAINWYSKAVTTTSSDREGNFDSTMNDCDYQLVARQAELYLQGGNGLERDPNKAGEMYTEAADMATEAMKGKLASRYYCLAEEAWAEVEEEEEEG